MNPISTRSPERPQRPVLLAQRGQQGVQRGPARPRRPRKQGRLAEPRGQRTRCRQRPCMPRKPGYSARRGGNGRAADRPARYELLGLSHKNRVSFRIRGRAYSIYPCGRSTLHASSPSRGCPSRQTDSTRRPVAPNRSRTCTARRANTGFCWQHRGVLRGPLPSRPCLFQPYWSQVNQLDTAARAPVRAAPAVRRTGRYGPDGSRPGDQSLDAFF